MTVRQMAISNKNEVLMLAPTGKKRSKPVATLKSKGEKNTCPHTIGASDPIITTNQPLPIK